MMSRTIRQVLDITLGAAKSVQSVGSIAWKYLKVEAVPPLTVSFFSGPGGRKLEQFVGKISNGFINALDGRIKEIDAEAERERQEILAAIQAHEKKQKAEAKAREAAHIKEIAMKAAEAVKKAAAAAEQKKAEEAAKKPKAKEEPIAKAPSKAKAKKAKKPPPKKSK